MGKQDGTSPSALATGSLHASPTLAVARAALDGNRLVVTPPVATTLTSVLHQHGLTPRPQTAQVQGASVSIPEGALATRRETAALLPLDIGLPVATGAPLATSSTLGPFSGVAGPFWLDLHLPAKTLQVRHASFAQPLLVVTRGRLLPGAARSISLDGGTVWILARSLCRDAPEGTYVGFTIATGRIDFPRAPSVSDSTVTVSGTLDLKLAATPHDPRTTDIAGNSTSSIEPPSTASLTWKDGAVEVELGNGSCSCYGQTFGLTSPARVFEWQAEIHGLTLAFADSTPGVFDASRIHGPLVQARGRASVSAAWLLPGYSPPDTDHWSEAAGPGWWSLALRETVTARWGGAPVAAKLPAARAVVDRGQFWLIDHAATADSIDYPLSLWTERGGRVPLELKFGDSFRFAFGSGSAAGDTVAVGCAPIVNSRRPVTVAGEALAANRFDGGVLILGAAGGGPWSVHVSGARTVGAARHAISLQNALLTVADPAGASLEGTTSDGRDVGSGTLRILLACYGWLPTLPDPYVSNIRPGTPWATPKPIEVALRWGSATGAPQMSFHGGLGAPTVALGQPSSPAPAPAQQPGPRGVPTQVAQGRARPPVAVQPSLTHVETPPAAPALIKEAVAAEARLDATLKLNTEVPGSRGARLLDVSGAKDLIGVGLNVAENAGEATFALDGNAVVTPLGNVAALMLPQVQWEPVRTLEIDNTSVPPFPARLDFIDDGGPTLVTADTRTLVASVPDLVVDAVIDAYSASPSTAVKVVTTLPFGLAARFELKVRPKRLAEDVDDQIDLVMPAFHDQALAGARQLKLVAGRPHLPGQSNAFESLARDSAGLLQHAGIGSDGHLQRGGPLPQEVATLFDGSFTGFVPLTRLDLSGYGESCFSEWGDPGALATIGKAQFQVLVGRTALEIVKAVSVIYPWGITVTRTITIERRGGGGVIRRDSGWQASSDGVFRFPLDRGEADTPAAHYIIDVEPGLLRGLSDVHDIRDAGGAPIQFGSGDNRVSLVPVLFDARATLARARRADGSYDTTSADAEAVLGFLQELPNGRRLTADELAAMFGVLRDPDAPDGGAVGGRLDAELELANSHFTFRARRLEVAYRSTSPQALVGVVRGTPIFTQAGAWGVARRSVSASGEATEATSVEEARGTPLVTTGKLDPGTSTASTIAIAATGGTPRAVDVGTFLFRDPDDVYKQTSEARREYGFLQSSPAHALFFPDPYLASRGATEITPSSPLELADPFLRTTTKGVFPASSASLRLGRAPFRIEATGALTGGYGTPAAPIDLPAGTPGSLPLNSAGSRYAQYNRAKLGWVVTADSWQFELENVQVWSDILGLAQVIGFSADLSAGTGLRPQLKNIANLFGGALSDGLATAAKWLCPPDPDGTSIDLGATNTPCENVVSIGLSANTGFAKTKLPTNASTHGGGEGGGEHSNAEVEFGFDMLQRFSREMVSRGDTETAVSIGMDLTVTVPLTPYLIKLGAALEIELAQGGDATFDVTAFVGFGIGYENVFTVEAVIKLGVDLKIEPTDVLIGFLIGVELEIDLVKDFPIVDVLAELEFLGYPQPGLVEDAIFVRDEHTHALTAERTDLGKKIGDVWTGRGDYFIGHGSVLLHVTVLFVFTVDQEWEQDFATRSS